MPTSSARLVGSETADEGSLIATLVADSADIQLNGAGAHRDPGVNNSLRRRGTRRLSSISIAQLSSLAQQKAYTSPINARESEAYGNRVSDLELANDVYRSILDQERNKLRLLSLKLKQQEQIIKVQTQEKELAELRLQRLCMRLSPREYSRQRQIHTPIPLILEPINCKNAAYLKDSMEVYGSDQDVVNLSTLMNEDTAKAPPEGRLFDGPSSYSEANPTATRCSTQATESNPFYLSDDMSSDQSTLFESCFPEPSTTTRSEASLDGSADALCSWSTENKYQNEPSNMKSYSGNANRHSAIIGNHLLEVDIACIGTFTHGGSESFELLPSYSAQQKGSVQLHRSISEVRYIASAISKSSTDGSITRAQPSVDAPTVSCRVGRTFNTPLGGLKESTSPTSPGESTSYWVPVFSGENSRIGNRSKMLRDTTGRAKPIMGRSSVAAYHV